MNNHKASDDNGATSAPQSVEDYWQSVYPIGEPEQYVTFHGILPALYLPERYGPDRG